MLMGPEIPFENIIDICLGLDMVELNGIALGYGLDDRGFDSQQGLGIFLFTAVSWLALGPTQHPIQ
jgi:hypothetical protein